MPANMGFPCDPAQTQALQDLLLSAQQQLQAGVTGILAPLADTSGAVYQLLQQVQQSANRVAGRNVTQAANQLSPILQAVQLWFAGQNDAAATQLAQAQAALATAGLTQPAPQPGALPVAVAPQQPANAPPRTITAFSAPLPAAQPSATAGALPPNYIAPGNLTASDVAALGLPLEQLLAMSDQQILDAVLAMQKAQQPQDENVPPGTDMLTQEALAAAQQNAAPPSQSQQQLLQQAQASAASLAQQVVALHPSSGISLGVTPSQICDVDYVSLQSYACDWTPPTQIPPVTFAGVGGCGNQFSQPPITQIGQGGGIKVNTLPSGIVSLDFSGAFPNGIPLPGSTDWCFIQTQIDAMLTSIGNTVVQWINTNLDSKHILDGLSAAVDSMDCGANVFCQGVKKLLEGIAWLVEKGRVVIDTLLDLIKTSMAASWQLLPRCNAPIVIGILLLKTMCKTIEDGEYGTDAFAWIVIHLRIDTSKVQEFLDKLLDYYCPNETPSAAEVADAWINGKISNAQRDCLLRFNNVDPATYLPFIYARGEKLGPEQAIEFVKRMGGSDLDEDNALRAVGVVDPITRQAMRSLYIEVPTIADHLHWLQRQVFDQQYVQRYNLLDGFDSKFWPAFGCDLTIQGMTKKNAQYHYAAHWINPAPTQMHEFLYRLRPGKAGVTDPFLLSDFTTLLAEQDIAPRARQWFADTVYRVPALSYLRDMYRYGVINEADLQSYHQDLGYTLQDSERFVGVDRLIKARIRTSESAGWTPRSLGKAFAIGQVDQTFVSDEMARQGFNAAETQGMMGRARADFQYQVISRARSRMLSRTTSVIDREVKTGTMSVDAATDALTSLGWPQPYAAAVARLSDTDRRAQLAKTGISHLRTAYLAGEVDLDYVRDNLNALGIVPDALEGYLTVWQLELTSGRKRRTAAQIVQDVADGEVSVDDAAGRLHNLGYSDYDIQLYLADVQFKIVTHDAESKAAQLMGGRFAPWQLGKSIVQTQQLTDRLVKDLMRHESPAKLRRWLKADTITPQYYVERLLLYGWDCANINKEFDLVRKEQIDNANAKHPKESIGQLLIDTPYECAGGTAVPVS